MVIVNANLNYPTRVNDLSATTIDGGSKPTDSFIGKDWSKIDPTGAVLWGTDGSVEYVNWDFLISNNQKIDVFSSAPLWDHGSIEDRKPSDVQNNSKHLE
jgi:hypothetical protein